MSSPNRSATVSLPSGSQGREIKRHCSWGRLYVSPQVEGVVVPLGWVLWMVISKGISAIASPDWWQKSQKGILPDQFGGGVYHAIYGTVVQSAVAAIIAVPLGIMAAVYLVVVFGFYSRLLEYQADLFGCRLLSFSSFA